MWLQLVLSPTSLSKSDAATVEDLLSTVAWRMCLQSGMLEDNGFNSMKQTSKSVLNKIEPVHFLLELVQTCSNIVQLVQL